MRYMLLTALLLAALMCNAAIFMQQDKNGNVTYSDTPLQNSAVMTNSKASSNTSSISTNSTETEMPPDLPMQTVAKAYTTFLVISPKNQETIQNQPQIPVEVTVEPPLQKGDKIMVLLDGKPVGEPFDSTHLMLGEVERGQHQLSAIIINSSQQVVKQSNTVTIYVHRVGVNSPARQAVS